MTLSLLGAISLNISFVLYLILYLPQVIHNRKSANIAELSLGLHLLLFTSYLFDLCYGFAGHLPWQYKTVSIVGLVLVSLQHVQLTQFFVTNKRQLQTLVSSFFLLLSTIGLYYFFNLKQNTITPQTTFFLATLARSCGLMYCLPQIVRNRRLKSANALSPQFLLLNLTLALLDTISAWTLEWGWPNKLAGPITMMLMLTLLYQIRKYTVQPTPLVLQEVRV